MFQRSTVVGLTLFFFLQSLAWAENEIYGASVKACSTADASVCSTVRFDSNPSTGKDSAFTLNLSGVSASEVEHLKVSLWMPDMGHGSSPVQISSLGNNQFRVQSVYFIMAGAWQVVVQFQDEATQHEIRVPVSVQ